MWPAKDTIIRLPEHLILLENTEIVELDCQRCGIVARFSAAGCRPEEIMREAREHRCPEENR
jgi:hypothetical protein